MSEMLALAKEQAEEKGYMKMMGGGVVLTGGGSLLPGTQELAQEVFGLPARIGAPVRLLGLTEEVASPVFATAIGLLLYGSQKAAGATTERRRKPQGVKGALDRMKDWLREFF